MTAAAGARNLFKVDAGVVFALMEVRLRNSRWDREPKLDRAGKPIVSARGPNFHSLCCEITGKAG